MSTSKLMAQKSYFLGCTLCCVILFKLNVAPALHQNAFDCKWWNHTDQAACWYSNHTQLRKTYPNQTSFLQPGPSAPLQLTAKDDPFKAEVIQALKIVEWNMPFASGNDSGKSFAIQFPDSNIAKSYKMEETKAKYFIQCGIHPHLCSILLENMKNMLFMFHFNETTTS